MLIVIVGARGAGKTTLLEALRAKGVMVLQPSTTRLPRFDNDKEYDFVKQWTKAKYAWTISVGDKKYGMRKTELAKASDAHCATVFEPLSLHVFESARRSFGIETMTIGLDTIRGVAEQHGRVGGDESRKMDEAALTKVTKIVAECDVVLKGDAQTVADATLAMIALLQGRGGVVTIDALRPLIRANAFIADGDEANIRPASYDLRVGPEILCQGQVTELSDANPRFEIPPYSYAVVSALERANLPPFVIGRFDLKVSYFFEGVILSNGPQIDPGYKGALFCMLYNGSGKPKLLTFGKQFATIDFTTTTTITQGYRQKYQLKQRMAQFASDNAVTGKGGAIVQLVDEKVAIVDRKVGEIKTNFWAIAGAVIAISVVAPTILVPIFWIEIGTMHTERLAIEDAQRKEVELLSKAREERAAAAALLASAKIRSSASEPKTDTGGNVVAPNEPRTSGR
jgi:deoxycytidine triphosphate deaminase